MKNIKRLLTLMFLSLLLLTVVGCGNEDKESKEVGPYGQRIEEDLTSTNIIDDNYRNYYEIFVRSFYDSDGNGIGDLKGVTQKLDYIKELGFTGIWLMPIHPSPTYHKYDVKDYYNVDPSYGTMADLEELISECHKRGIRLILDLVLNHSSTTNPWFSTAKKAFIKSQSNQQLTEEEEKFKDFYSFFTSKPNGKTVYSFDKYFYEANFDSGMPEFNCDSPYVQQEFKNIMKFYIDKGIDGFRLDAVKYYYVDSTAKSVEFLSKLNQWAKEINPNAYMVGECWDNESIIGKYYESGMDSFFNFSMSVSSANTPLINSLNQDGKFLDTYYNGLLDNISLANGHIPAPFLDNHDMPRFTSTSELEISVNKNKFQYALLQMMNGTTFTYYGSEVGMVGTNASSNPDQNVRIPMYWGEDTGECSALPGATVASYPHGSVKNQMKFTNSLYQFYKKCLLIRNQNPEIARGEVSLIKQDKDNKLLFIKKTYNGSEIGIIFNFSATNQLNVNYIDEGFNKVVGQLVVDIKDTYIGSKEDKSIILPPYSIAIVK